MKKIIYFVFLIIYLFNINIVNASNKVILTQDIVDNVFCTRRGGGKPYLSLPYKIFTINNRAVYCIESGIEIITNSYISYDSLNESPFDDKTNKLIELIGYYGYDYPNHQTLKYRMAAQALIWEKTSGQIIEFWTKQYGYGDNININKEKDEIMKLVNNHSNIPSFSNKQFNLVLGETLEINDTNNILDGFYIEKNNDIEASIVNNNLSIKPLKAGKINLQLKKKKYDNEKSIIYIGSNPKSQKLAFFRYSEDVAANITINVVGGCVKVNKLDYDTKTITPIVNEVTLSNAKYGIYSENNNLISTLITNEVGYAESEDILSIGKYYLKEISPSNGYNIDNEKYYFEIKKDNLIINLTVYEKIINRDVLIKKFIRNIKDNELEFESNIKFNIYDKNNNLIKTIVTDKNGKVNFNLYYGTYNVKQINTTIGYQKVDDFIIKINNSTPINLEYSLIDLPIETKIKVNKKDFDSKKNILQEGITFKIKNRDTNSYICYNDSNNKSVCDYKTNKNGEFITPNSLTYGNYQIEEIIKPNGYILNSKLYYFNINENSNIINNGIDNYILIDLYNKQIKGSIKINKSGEILKIENNNFYYENINLEGVTFSLYAKENIVSFDGTIHYKKGDLIKEFNTNMDGNIIFNNLYLGSYIVKETKTLNGYERDSNEYEIVLDELNNNKSIELFNRLIKGNLQIIKKDKDTNEVIPNTLFSIFNDKDECLISSETDFNGVLTINNLPLGKYYLKEIKSAKGYLLNDEIIEFEIKDKNEIMELIMFNVKNIVNVPNTGINSNVFVKLISIVLVIIGSVCLIYVKKNV